MVADLPQLFDMRIVALPEVIPDRRALRHYVRLVAAVRNNVMGALLKTKMLAAEVPAYVHQLNSIQRAAPAPRSHRGMCALSMAGVLNRDKTTGGTSAIRSAYGVTNLCEQNV